MSRPYVVVQLRKVFGPGSIAEAYVATWLAPRCVLRRGCQRQHDLCDLCNQYRHGLPHGDDGPGGTQWCHICQVSGRAAEEGLTR